MSNYSLKITLILVIVKLTEYRAACGIKDRAQFKADRAGSDGEVDNLQNHGRGGRERHLQRGEAKTCQHGCDS